MNETKMAQQIETLVYLLTEEGGREIMRMLQTSLAPKPSLKKIAWKGRLKIGNGMGIWEEDFPESLLTTHDGETLVAYFVQEN